MNLFTVILYIVWGVLSTLTIIAGFSCDISVFWRVVLVVAGCFNLVCDATYIPEIIKYFKGKED